MSCDKYLELLSARLDGALTGEEERELEEHLAICLGCRAVGAQLAALQGTFPELEETPAPEGFTQGVMDRIREEARPKVIPLFKRPQVRALAGLAACLVLAAGLYGASHSQRKAADEYMMLRSFNREAVEEFSDASACESLTGSVYGADGVEDVPQVASYAAPETQELLKTAPGATADDLAGSRLSSLELSENTLAMDYFPEGAAELLPPETAVQPYPGGGTVYLDVPKDIYDQIQRLAVEQGMTFSCALTGDGGAENGPFTLIILEE
jgi:hypothetical protein